MLRLVSRRPLFSPSTLSPSLRLLSPLPFPSRFVSTTSTSTTASTTGNSNGKKAPSVTTKTPKTTKTTKTTEIDQEREIEIEREAEVVSRVLGLDGSKAREAVRHPVLRPRLHNYITLINNIINNNNNNQQLGDNTSLPRQVYIL